MCNKYCGWANYETWAVKLWIDNDQGLYNYFAESAQSAYDVASANAYNTRKENTATSLAKVIETYFIDENPLVEQANVYSDLLNAALSSVNWREIANSLLEDVEEEPEEESEE